MTRSLQISLIVLVIFIGIFFLNRNSQSKLDSISEPLFNGNPQDIFKFFIQNGCESIEIKLLDTLWRISNNDSLVIKPRSIDNLFQKVLKVKRGTIISENSDKYSKYSVDDSSGTHLELINFNGEIIGKYIFGRSKSDYSRSYVRLTNDPKVYLADQNVSYMLSTRPTYWGEKPTKEEILPQTLDTQLDTTLIN